MTHLDIDDKIIDQVGIIVQTKRPLRYSGKKKAIVKEALILLIEENQELINPNKNH